MTLSLYDNATGTDLELFGATPLRDDRQGSVDVTPFTGSDSAEAYVTSLENAETITVQGRLTAPRLIRSNNYPNTGDAARGEWLRTFDEFVNGGPGDGYEIRLDYRNRTLTGVPEELEWTISGGERFDAEYSVTFRVGDAVGLSNSVSPSSPSVGGDIIIDGETIPTFREFQITKQQELEVSRRAFATTAEENDITTTGGATRTIRVVGLVEGTESERNTFDTNLSDSIGQDTIVDVEDPFTGRTYSGIVRSYESGDEAGRTRVGEYGIEVVEGSK
jgi:hypothetical protein